MTLLANRYRLDALIGQGGMGRVHLAHDTVLERKVAIKLLPDEARHEAHARERFRREALAAAALDHPFICKIHQVGEHEGVDFIVMEFVDGRTLERVARDGGLTPRQLLDCAHEIVQALDEAHRRGIVHRDLKPSNVMLTVHGHVVNGMACGVNITAIVAGIAAEAAGISDEAGRWWREARGLAEQYQSPYLRAQVDLWEGRHLVSQAEPGRRAAGEGMLRQAADAFTAMKMPLHLDLSRRWLSQ